MTTHPYSTGSNPVFVLTEHGPLAIAPDGGQCPVCRGTDYIPIWNPEITDGLTHALMPADRRVLTPPCPACLPEEWQDWWKRGYPQ